MIYTTLNKIRKHIPCVNGWIKLLAELKKTCENPQISLLQILEINGIYGALWALRTIDGYDLQIRELALRFAESMLPIYESKYPNDHRPRNCINVRRKYDRGEATEEELRTACAAAWDSARYVTWDAALASAWDAAWTIACATAWDSVIDASWGAGCGAADFGLENTETIFRAWLEEIE